MYYTFTIVLSVYFIYRAKPFITRERSVFRFSINCSFFMSDYARGSKTQKSVYKKSHTPLITTITVIGLCSNIINKNKTDLKQTFYN